MRLIITTFLFLSIAAHGQTAKEIWEPLLSNKKIATYFSGMWESLGITVKETGEKITVYHKGDHFELKDGINVNEVNYNITLVEKSVKDMGTYGNDGEIDEKESFKIMGTLFTPFVRSSLDHPMMQKKFQMKLAGIENHIHVYLKGGSENDVASHTLIFFNKDWMVIEGIHGEAERVFNITVQEAIAYQREAFKALKSDSRKGWRNFKKFYLKWRDGVSEG